MSCIVCHILIAAVHVDNNPSEEWWDTHLIYACGEMCSSDFYDGTNHIDDQMTY
jgi:hypothetical protein